MVGSIFKHDRILGGFFSEFVWESLRYHIKIMKGIRTAHSLYRVEHKIAIVLTV